MIGQIAKVAWIFFSISAVQKGIGYIITVFKPEQPKDLSKSCPTEGSVNPESSQLPVRSMFCLEMLSLGGILGQILYFLGGKRKQP